MNSPWSAIAPSDHCLTDVESAWLAAAIDGEGTIAVWKERRSKNTSGWRYKAAVRVFNTNHDFVARVCALAGGTVSVKDRRKRGKGHRTLYAAVIPQSSIAALLARIAPFLIIKARQADAVMRFCRAVEEAPMRTAFSHEAFEQFYLELRALNMRGTSGG